MVAPTTSLLSSHVTVDKLDLLSQNNVSGIKLHRHLQTQCNKPIHHTASILNQSQSQWYVKHGPHDASQQLKEAWSVNGQFLIFSHKSIQDATYIYTYNCTFSSHLSHLHCTSHFHCFQSSGLIMLLVSTATSLQGKLTLQNV